MPTLYCVLSFPSRLLSTSKIKWQVVHTDGLFPCFAFIRTVSELLAELEHLAGLMQVLTSSCSEEPLLESTLMYRLNFVLKAPIYFQLYSV